MKTNRTVHKNCIQYCKNDKFHRNGNKPAVIWADGTMFWYKKGKYHRDGDKPAVIYDDGTVEWFGTKKESYKKKISKNSLTFDIHKSTII